MLPITLHFAYDFDLKHLFVSIFFQLFHTSEKKLCQMS